MEFAEAYLAHQRETHGKRAGTPTESLVRKGAETVGRLVMIDGFEFEYIRRVLLWANKDPFWQDKVLSLAALRKKTDGLMKFQRIATAYERAQNPTPAASPSIITDPATQYRSL